MATTISFAGAVAATPTYADGPSRISIGTFGCGEPCLSALATLEPHIDMVRYGTVPIHPVHCRDKPGCVVQDRDDFLTRLAGMYGWNRILLIVNDLNDNARPDAGEMVGVFARTAALFPYVEWIQVYNEPNNFDGLTGKAYVKQHLVPIHAWVNGENARRREYNAMNAGPSFVPLPEIKLVGAAFYGEPSGRAELEQAARHGLFDLVDVVTTHDYNDGLEAKFAAQLRNSSGYKETPIWVTETGVHQVDQQDEHFASLGQMERDLNKKYREDLTQISSQMFLYQLMINDGRTGDPRVIGYSLIETPNGVTWHERNTVLWNQIMSLRRTIAPGYTGAYQSPAGGGSTTTAPPAQDPTDPTAGDGGLPEEPRTPGGAGYEDP